jgi:hypothetical protein
MTERLDKNSRKASLVRWKSQQRADARSKLPLPDSEMKKLFDMLDEELPRVGCDHTLRLVSQWCDLHAVPFAKVESWLRDNGGYCDCEALANAEEAWQDTIRDGSS